MNHNAPSIPTHAILFVEDFSESTLRFTLVYLWQGDLWTVDMMYDVRSFCLAKLDVLTEARAEME